MHTCLVLCTHVLNEGENVCTSSSWRTVQSFKEWLHPSLPDLESQLHAQDKLWMEWILLLLCKRHANCASLGALNRREKNWYTWFVWWKILHLQQKKSAELKKADMWIVRYTLYIFEINHVDRSQHSMPQPRAASIPVRLVESQNARLLKGSHSHGRVSSLLSPLCRLHTLQDAGLSTSGTFCRWAKVKKMVGLCAWIVFPLT